MGVASARLSRCDECRTCVCHGLWLVVCWLDCKLGHREPVCSVHDRHMWYVIDGNA